MSIDGKYSKLLHKNKFTMSQNNVGHNRRIWEHMLVLIRKGYWLNTFWRCINLDLICILKCKVLSYVLLCRLIINEYCKKIKNVFEAPTIAMVLDGNLNFAKPVKMIVQYAINLGITIGKSYKHYYEQVVHYDFKK